MPRTISQTIMIVGAGPVGLSCALALARAGQTVRVIDSGARGAGWASGGMLGAVYETLHRPDVPNALTDMAFEGVALWHDLAAQLNIELTHGTIFIARTSDEAQFFTALASNPRSTLVATKLPIGLIGLAAWQCGRDVALEPRATLSALKKACAAVGVTFMRGTVTACAPHVVTLDDGSVHPCDRVILATGQGGDGLRNSVPELACIAPVKGQLLAVAPPPHQALEGVVRAGRLYLIPRGQKIVIGATSNAKDIDPAVLDVAAQIELHREAVALYPALRDAPIVESWAGLRPMTPDGLPIIGQSRSNSVILACGTYRNGWLLAPAIAQMIVSIVAQDGAASSKLQSFSPSRFPI